MDPRGALLARRQRLRLLLAQEILFLAEAVQAAAVAVVVCAGGCRAEEEGFLLDAFCEQGFSCVGGVSA